MCFKRPCKWHVLCRHLPSPMLPSLLHFHEQSKRSRMNAELLSTSFGKDLKTSCVSSTRSARDRLVRDSRCERKGSTFRTSCWPEVLNYAVNIASTELTQHARQQNDIGRACNTPTALLGSHASVYAGCTFRKRCDLTC